ncbi:hypothetical protein JB92DRAFT_3114851 [Gautieria morchelliformis]|nr:hypothetical protein JB92DRAFT_3114851 [Gautieria morchelliformis]
MPVVRPWAMNKESNFQYLRFAILMAAPTHHERFYWHYGSTVFLVGNKLYMSLLEPHSIILKDMFAMPGTSGSIDNPRTKGLTDENPIKIGHPFSPEKLDNLLGWFHRIGPLSPSMTALTNILGLGSFLEWDGA